MKRHRLAIGHTAKVAPVGILLVVLLACTPAAGPTAPPRTGPTATAEPVVPPTPDATPTGLATPNESPQRPPAESTSTPGAPETDEPQALPDDPWRTAELRDARTSESFRINDLAGRLVIVEPMAIWCANCRAQQNAAREALAELGRDDLVYVSLDVDPNETEADLARYADEHEWPWRFVVASREVARSLAETFGDQVLSPPSTPKIVIAPDGRTEVSFGHKSAQQLEAEFATLLP